MTGTSVPTLLIPPPKPSNFRWVVTIAVCGLMVALICSESMGVSHTSKPLWSVYFRRVLRPHTDVKPGLQYRPPLTQSKRSKPTPPSEPRPLLSGVNRKQKVEQEKPQPQIKEKETIARNLQYYGTHLLFWVLPFMVISSAMLAWQKISSPHSNMDKRVASTQNLGPHGISYGTGSPMTPPSDFGTSSDAATLDDIPTSGSETAICSSDNLISGEPDFATEGPMKRATSKSDIAVAIEWLGDMIKQDLNPDEASYHTVIHACARERDGKSANEWLNAMIEQGLSPNAHTYSMVVHTCAQSGEVGPAVGWLDAMSKQGIKPEIPTYHKVTMACVHRKDSSLAVRMLGVMRGAMQEHNLCVSGEIYNMVLNVCAENGDQELASQVSRAILTDGVSIGTRDQTTSTNSQPVTASSSVCRMNELASVQEGVGDLSPTVLDMEQEDEDGTIIANGILDSKRAEAYQAMLSACAKSGDITDLVQWLETMTNEGLHPDVEVYTMAMDTCTKSGNSTLALKLLRSMLDKDHEPSVSTYTSYTCLMQWIETITNENIHPEVEAYTMAIDACTKSGNNTLALKLLGSMMDKSLKPSVATYTSVMQDCNAPSLMQWLETMTNEGHHPEVEAYTMAIDTCTRSRKSTLALKLMTSMLDKGLKADVSTYSNVMQACVDSADPSSIIQSVETVTEKGHHPAEEAYTVAIDICTRSKKHTLALKLITCMLDKGLKPDVSTYSSVMQACADDGDTTSLLQWLDTLTKKDLHPEREVYTMAIDSCSKSGDGTLAMSLLTTMVNKGLKPTVSTRRMAMQAFGESSAK